MVPITYYNDGRIFEVHEAYNELQEPSEAIPAVIQPVVIFGI
ncbi:MAG: hypothetical protein ACJZ9G_02780 [Rhodospirillales bacterium]|tara:strand:+ start:217 stop:342 length:126 start_codon:yes stop_codon:yes gene_type:complete